VKFQKPRFEVYFSGNKIFEFEDVDFQPEAVGFYLFEFDGITKAEGFFDDFIISGQAIPDDPFAVKPKPKLTDDLIIQLKDPKAEVRRNAAKALGEIGEAKAVEPLMAALKDPDFLVRENAVIALGEIGDVKAVEPLVAAVKDGLVRPYATTIALGQIGDKRGLEE
jgi:HEAT repeat protein